LKEYTPVLRSQKQTGRLMILDTFGELSSVYAIADIAFVGGSLVRTGGQSVFQPISQGVIAYFGPNMQNQRDISALAIAEGVAIQVENTQMLTKHLMGYVSVRQGEEGEKYQVKKQERYQKCRALIERNQGVSKRYVEKMGEFLDV
jgi:3-deoxy-D-manno-octulosonic-acid transferase